MNSHLHYDVIILGSGFGGSLLATILCGQGLSVAVVDRSRHPRFAIGESSTPAADLILHDLTTRYGLNRLRPLTRFGSWRSTYPEIRCGCKRGFSYFWHADGSGFRATPTHGHELLVAASASRDVADCQWYRPDVDQLFARTAADASAAMFEDSHVTTFEHPRPRDWRVIVQREGGQEQLRCDFLIDATGPAGRLLNWMGVIDQTHRLATHSSAVYGHWTNVEKTEHWLKRHNGPTDDYPFACDDSAVHHVLRDGWLWQLRFEDGLTSLGYVSVGRSGQRVQTGDQAEDDTQVWRELCQSRPVLAELTANARLADFPGRLYQTGRLQRLWRDGAGEDWAALPFTVGFVDPLHSTGIAHTLSGVERLAAIITENPGEDRREALHIYSRQVIDELLLIDRLVAGCYLGLCDFDLFRTWSMVYFAAATTYERRRLDQQGSLDQGRDEAGFLCAEDSSFVATVDDLFKRLQSLVSRSVDPTSTAAFRDLVRERIEPFNHVGLFSPQTPHMYHYAAAEKP